MEYKNIGKYNGILENNKRNWYYDLIIIEINMNVIGKMIKEMYIVNNIWWRWI